MDNSPNARLSKYPRLRWLLWKLGVLSDEHYSVSWLKSILIHDLRKKLPFPDRSVDYVYTSHVLEHLAAADAPKLIEEVFRVLKPGGMVRLVVPDLAYVRGYLVRCKHRLIKGRASVLECWVEQIRFRDPHLGLRRAIIESRLTHAGCINAVVCQYRQGQVQGCATLCAQR